MAKSESQGGLTVCLVLLLGTGSAGGGELVERTGASDNGGSISVVKGAVGETGDGEELCDVSRGSSSESKDGTKGRGTVVSIELE